VVKKKTIVATIQAPVDVTIPVTTATDFEQTNRRYNSLTDGIEAKEKRVLVLSGFGPTMRASKGTLYIRQGRTIDQILRSEVQVTAGTQLETIIVITNSGSLTVGALCLCDAFSIAVFRVTEDRHLAVMVASERADVDLRRLQYSAASNDDLLTRLCLFIVAGKLDAYLERITVFSNTVGYKDALDPLNNARSQLQTGAQREVNGLRLIEARYSGMWLELLKSERVTFKPSDKAKAPAHWLSFGSRVGANGYNNRKATRPYNALLNYAYGGFSNADRTRTPGRWVRHCRWFLACG
jgi:CRISPR/Cas system-associated endonuclease Cas1